MRKTVFVYAILDSSYIQTLSLNPESVRFNRTKTRFVFKTYKEEPLLVNTPFYTKSHLKNILQNDEWRNNLNIN